MTGRFTVDDLARPVPLDGGAERIVSLAPSCTDCLLALGVADRLVGVEEHSDDPALAGVPRVGGFRHVTPDAIAALEPDLVVAASLHAVALVPALAARGLRVFVAHPRTVDGILDGMARLAAVIGIARAAAPRLAALRARVAAVVAAALRRRSRPLTYVELSPEGRTGGPSSFLDDLVTRAGGINLGGIARVEWPALPAERVLAHDPDVVVIAAYPGSDSAAGLAARPGWHRCTAVRAGRVFEIPAPLVKRPGAGAVEGLERLADLLAGIA